MNTSINGRDNCSSRERIEWQAVTLVCLLEGLISTGWLETGNTCAGSVEILTASQAANVWVGFHISRRESKAGGISRSRKKWLANRLPRLRPLSRSVVVVVTEVS